MDMTVISGAMAAAKALRDVLQAAASLKIDNETLARINAALGEVSAIQEKLFEAREQLFTLQKENEELRQQLRANDEWEKQKNHYRLVNMPGGATVWESKDGNPKHFACVSCFAKRAIVILQTSEGTGYYICPTCKVGYQLTQPVVREYKVITNFDPRRP
jgi:hypothetical protein